MEKWKIWYQQFDAKGNNVGVGFYTKDYVNFGNAVRVAKKIYGNRYDTMKFIWAVSKTNPWIKKCELCGKEYDLTIKSFKDKFDQFHTQSSVRIEINDPKKRTKDVFVLNRICTDCAEKARAVLIDMVRQQLQEN